MHRLQALSDHGDCCSVQSTAERMNHKSVTFLWDTASNTSQDPHQSPANMHVLIIIHGLRLHFQLKVKCPKWGFHQQYRTATQVDTQPPLTLQSSCMISSWNLGTMESTAALAKRWSATIWLHCKRTSPLFVPLQCSSSSGSFWSLGKSSALLRIQTPKLSETNTIRILRKACRPGAVDRQRTLTIQRSFQRWGSWTKSNPKSEFRINPRESCSYLQHTASQVAPFFFPGPKTVKELRRDLPLTSPLQWGHGGVEANGIRSQLIGRHVAEQMQSVLPLFASQGEKLEKSWEVMKTYSRHKGHLPTGRNYGLQNLAFLTGDDGCTEAVFVRS